MASEVVPLSNAHKIKQLRRLKVIRERSGASQEELATMLKTTQQTIGRWETGRSEPSLAQLRDMAIFFGCSVDGLLGRMPGYGIDSARLDLRRQPRKSGEDNAAKEFANPSFTGFWGHIGVLLPGPPHTRWYPITTHEYDRTSERVFNAAHHGQWVTCSTLSNRELVINTPNVDRIWFLDDDADPPKGDWEYVEHPTALEFFIALDAVDIEEEYEASEALKAAVAEFIEEHSQDELNDLLYHTNVYFGDGRAPSKFWTDESSIARFIGDADGNVIGMDGDREMIQFIEGSDRMWESYIPDHKIAMVEVPLIRANEGWQANWREDGAPPIGSEDDLAMHAEWESRATTSDKSRRGAARSSPKKTATGLRRTPTKETE